LNELTAIYAGICIGLLIAVFFGPPSDVVMALVVIFTIALLLVNHWRIERDQDHG
jgi:uncharacterized membrane protein YgaE (UPF0421/DUF939 family)